MYRNDSVARNDQFGALDIYDMFVYARWLSACERKINDTVSNGSRVLSTF